MECTHLFLYVCMSADHLLISHKLTHSILIVHTALILHYKFNPRSNPREWNYFCQHYMNLSEQQQDSLKCAQRCSAKNNLESNVVEWCQQLLWGGQHIEWAAHSSLGPQCKPLHIWSPLHTTFFKKWTPKSPLVPCNFCHALRGFQIPRIHKHSTFF